MSQQTSIMERLAWRAKWRKRWQTWKTRIFCGLLLAVGIPMALLFTPWLPQKCYEYIVENRIDPTTKKASLWATESMYQLGRFYSITLRDEEAAKCYDTIAEWNYGYRLIVYVYNNNSLPHDDLKKLKERKIGLEPAAVPWLGYAVFRLGEYLDNTKHKQFAYKIYKDFYLPAFEQKDGEDPELTSRARTFVTLYTQ